MNVTLRSSDGATMVISKPMAKQLLALRSLYGENLDNLGEVVIPVPSVILYKVLVYCRKHVDAGIDDLEPWDDHFVEVDQDTLFDIHRAADYLNIKSLLDLTYQRGVGMIKAADYLLIRRPVDLTCQRVADMTKEAGKVISLKSSDGDVFMIEKAVALESQTIKDIIKDGCTDSSIPLPSVTSRILSKVIEYCKKHVDAAGSWNPGDQMTLRGWDANFIKVDLVTLFDLVQATDYLNIRSLLDLTYQTMMDSFKVHGDDCGTSNITFNFT